MTILYGNNKYIQNLVGDFDGDSKDDILLWNSKDKFFKILLSDGSELNDSLLKAKFFLNPFKVTNTSIILTGDFNGDKKNDLLLWDYKSGEWRLAINDGNQFKESFKYTNYVWVNTLQSGNLWVPFVGDFNGDGKDDILLWNKNLGLWQVLLSTGNEFQLSEGKGYYHWLLKWAIGDVWKPVIGDFNGDGKDDILVINIITGECQLAFSDGKQFIPSISKNGAIWLKLNNFNENMIVGSCDVHRVGRDELLIYNPKCHEIQIALNKDNEFHMSYDINKLNILNGTDINLKVLFGDFNGDGAYEAAIPQASLEKWRLIKLEKNNLQNLSYKTITKDLTFIYPPVFDYNFMFQRPQQMLKALAEAGANVLYINSEEFYPQLDPVSIPFPELPNFKVLRKEVPISNYIHGKVILWCATIALPFLNTIPHDYVILDSCDLAEEEFQIQRSFLPEMEMRANMIVASSQAIVDDHATRGKKSVLVQNGADYEHFKAASLPIGAMPLEFPTKRPIIGFYGALQPWIDVDIIYEIAKKYNVVLIGGYKYWQLKPIVHPSITVLPIKNYKELPYYLSWFDICIIPFKLTKMMEGTNPVKFYEYLSAGKPVVATNLKELFQYKDVCYFADVSNVNSVIQRAYESNSYDKVLQRNKVAQDNSWLSKAYQVLKELSNIGVFNNE